MEIIQSLSSFFFPEGVMAVEIEINKNQIFSVKYVVIKNQ